MELSLLWRGFEIAWIDGGIEILWIAWYPCDFVPLGGAPYTDYYESSKDYFGQEEIILHSFLLMVWMEVTFKLDLFEYFDLCVDYKPGSEIFTNNNKQTMIDDLL